MRRVVLALLVLLLAGAVHLDWHLARPAHHHHRLSFGWEQHWLFAIVAFAATGWVIARVFPDRSWRAAAFIAAAALILAQGLEPIVEVALYAHRFGYPDDAGRWSAFFLCLAAGLPSYALAVWLCRPRHDRETPDTLARVA